MGCKWRLYVWVRRLAIGLFFPNFTFSHVKSCGFFLFLLSCRFFVAGAFCGRRESIWIWVSTIQVRKPCWTSIMVNLFLYPFLIGICMYEHYLLYSNSQYWGLLDEVIYYDILYMCFSMFILIRPSICDRLGSYNAETFSTYSPP